ncbi:hypothetical protein C5B91_07360 [Haloferax sp. Atlit-10N]|uniref:Uncharacterized protein n=1 Tax=Haloferax prahovense (strain DSM 18310 / JCM 13924 / TL6) TaxID=1227461 RepID=M0G174_HALPT|nr:MULTISPECIES: DUF5806 family protein [Haloferax]ELZ65323.1 hypothetical protein C457_17527 [Haloferax prahovense DSM 18310]RDZ45176.1 hypothetical protein C5B87_13610 [Haloferax sp. Atlit-16N]RDZ59047.1 hypothetical protein C5B91_07360 [Haloferax sp. Atlit-10N]
MTDESDEFETGASDAEEGARPDADTRAEADEAAADAAAATAESAAGTESAPADDDATDSEADEVATDSEADAAGAGSDAEGTEDAEDAVPEDVQKYARFKKVDGAQYDRVNDFLRQRTYVTAREWAIARLCADFRTETGVEMTKIGNNLPELVPFMTDTYTPQAVNQARSAFRDKVRKSGATFLYGAMSGFFTAEELDEMMYEVTEIAKFLLEVEGVDLSVEEELEAEERISSVMREVREASTELRQEELSDEE